ncbi:MAG: hypothetical protein ACREUZ_06020 [Burkholderiales bacterium]
MFTLTMLLLFAAFVLTLVSAAGRVPLWPAVLCLVLAALVQVWPAR